MWVISNGSYFTKDAYKESSSNEFNVTGVLHRMRDADKKKSSILSTLKKNERERKKLLETILKQLHQLANVDGY